VKKHAVILLSVITFLFGIKPAIASEVKVDVTLNPAGSFVAQTTKVKGFAYKTAKGIAAKNIEVDLKSITTGVGLRDKHLKKRLDVAKFPTAKLSVAQGKDGKGQAIVEIKGMKKKVSGTYKIEGSNLNAEFKMHLPDLDIKDINYMGVGVDDDVTVHVLIPIANQRKTASEQK
jgi:polyisoprenoid-binding protein YceI